MLILTRNSVVLAEVKQKSTCEPTLIGRPICCTFDSQMTDACWSENIGVWLLSVNWLVAQILYQLTCWWYQSHWPIQMPSAMALEGKATELKAGSFTFHPEKHDLRSQCSRTGHLSRNIDSANTNADIHIVAHEKHKTSQVTEQTFCLYIF